jgi:glycosyltransferase involved in cell wall biosynthesis
MDDLRDIPSPHHPAPLPGASPRRRASAARALRVDSAGSSRAEIGSRPGREIVAVFERRCGTVWFDYTDLVHYFEDNRVPTGIQRVQIGIFRASLAREPGVTAERIGACSFDPQRRCWVALPETLLASVCRAACHAATAGAATGDDEEAWRALTGALRQSVAGSVSAPFAPGDVLVNIGSSWWIADYLRYVQHLQRERGVLFASFVHDCIPLRVPETCSANLVQEFAAWFGAAMRTADFVLANSAHTARDIAALAPAHGGAAVTPQVIRLDARFDDGPQPGLVAAARLDAATHASLGIRRPFALFVSTLEARKNHLFVFQCWETLIERHGDAVPDLICVGKQGWLFDYTQNWLQVHPKLAQRVRLAGTLSDNDVAALYRTAQFTVYCSHYEGWGLPITESLCYGRVPVVPNHTALPEAGGLFAAYYEPGSHHDFCEQVEQVMNRKRRVELEARIRARYRPRAWSDVLAQIVSTVRDSPVRSGGDAAGFVVRPGCIYSMGRPRLGATAEPGVEPGDRLRHGIGWHAAEEWGGWSRQSQAQLLFTLPPRTRDLILYMLVRGGPADQTLYVQVAGSKLAGVALQANQRRLLRTKLDGNLAGAELLVTFAAPPYNLATHTDGNDTRDIGFGLEAVAVAEQRDAAARVEVLEHFLAPQ